MALPQAGWSPLHDAANRGHTAIVTELVRLGARLNGKTMVRRCAAGCSRSSASAPAVGLEPHSPGREQGSRPNCDCPRFARRQRPRANRRELTTALCLAVTESAWVRGCARPQAAQAARRVRPHLPVSLDFSHAGLTPLHCAAIYGQSDLCKELVRLRARVDDRNEVHFSPRLHRLRCTMS